MSSAIYVCDTSPLIFLSKIGKLNLLQLIFNKVYVPEAVYKEVTEGKSGKFDPGVAGAIAVKNAGWIKVRKVTSRKLVENLLSTIDIGESEAIALAKEMGAQLLIMDERKGRTVAKSFNIKVTGTLGLLVKAKEMKLLKTIRPAVIDLTALQGSDKFRVSAELIVEVLRAAGEWSETGDSVDRLKNAMLSGRRYGT